MEIGYYYIVKSTNLKNKIIDFCYKSNEVFYSLYKNEEVFYNHSDDIKFIKTKFNPGEYYPRICLPTFTSDFSKYIFNNNEIKLKVAIDSEKQNINKFSNFFNYHNHNIDLKRKTIILLERFYEICSYIEPCDSNNDSYSLKIRELLILICTEIESIFKNILIGNQISSIGKNYTTKDYIKLKDILKLDQYDSIYLMRFSSKSNSLKNPFKSWVLGFESQSLSFYNAYNLVKHNSENELSQANLKNLKSALCALIILYTAQTGFIISDEIRIITSPNFNIEEWYIDGSLKYDKEGVVCENWIPKKLDI